VIDFHEQATQALKRDLATFHCIPCWGFAAALTSPLHQARLQKLARNFAITGDPASEEGFCEKCGGKFPRVVRCIEPN
jgi:hypothetical protein